MHRPQQPPIFDWLNKFHHQTEKDHKYAEKALASYALGIKGKGALVGVIAQPGSRCCEAARRLSLGNVYSPSQAPHLPLPDCTHSARCDCVYRPAMSYEQMDER